MKNALYIDSELYDYKRLFPSELSKTDKEIINLIQLRRNLNLEISFLYHNPYSNSKILLSIQKTIKHFYMKLSGKYLDKQQQTHGADMRFTPEITMYGHICALEERKTFLVANQSHLPNEYYMAELEKVVNEIQKIAEEEKL